MSWSVDLLEMEFRSPVFDVPLPFALVFPEPALRPEIEFPPVRLILTLESPVFPVPSPDFIFQPAAKEPTAIANQSACVMIDLFMALSMDFPGVCLWIIKMDNPGDGNRPRGWKFFTVL